MIKNLLTYPILFVFMVLLQVLVLNNIQLSGFINPYLYIIFILWLPVEMNKVLVMFISFLLGLSVDVFSNTPGMHAAASVFLAFCRPYILLFMAPREGYEGDQVPGIQSFGLSWFITFSAIAVLLHHTFLFYVEVFRFSEFFSTLGRVLASFVFTMLLVILAQLFRYNTENRI